MCKHLDGICVKMRQNNKGHPRLALSDFHLMNGDEKHVCVADMFHANGADDVVTCKNCDYGSATTPRRLSGDQGTLVKSKIHRGMVKAEAARIAQRMGEQERYKMMLRRRNGHRHKQCKLTPTTTRSESDADQQPMDSKAAVTSNEKGGQEQQTEESQGSSEESAGGAPSSKRVAI